MNELTQLKEQLSQGAITEEEYRAKTAELLTQCAAAAQKHEKIAEIAEPTVAEDAVSTTAEEAENAPVIEVEAEVVEEAASVHSGPQAGWYPDPAGIPNNLRYWNGTAWTDDYTTLEPQPAASEPEPTQPAGIPQSPVVETPAAAIPPVAVPFPQQQNQQSAGGPQTPPNSNTSSTVPPTSGPAHAAPTVDAPYKPTGSDETLRLVAFIFSLISTLGCAIFIIPLAWCIPMTVHCWKIYKGTKPNTTAFGICTLLFVNLISGVLLLISQKDR